MSTVPIVINPSPSTPSIIINNGNGGGGSSPQPQPIVTQSKSSLQAVASRGSHLCNGLYTGSERVVSYKTRHEVPQDCYDIALVYGNYYDEGTDGPNPFTIKASLVVGTAIYPVFFNGQRNCVLEPGAVVESTPVGVSVKAGSTIYSIVCVTLANAGDKHPLGMPLYAERNEGSAITDITATGNVTNAGGFGYHPVAVVGRMVNPCPAVYLGGDSIMQGANDGWQDIGFMTRVLDAAKIPWIRVAKGAGNAGSMMGRQGMTRYQLAKYCSHAITNYGTNDLGGTATAATVIQNLTNHWKALKGLGLKVYQCTITPTTTSTDGFKTAENQTYKPNATQGAQRILVNDAIRQTPAPLDGYFETADAVETARNSGKWKFPSFTVDGLHPSQAGHVAMKDVVAEKLPVYDIVVPSTTVPIAAASIATLSSIASVEMLDEPTIETEAEQKVESKVTRSVKVAPKIEEE